MMSPLSGKLGIVDICCSDFTLSSRPIYPTIIQYLYLELSKTPQTQNVLDQNHDLHCPLAWPLSQGVTLTSRQLHHIEEEKKKKSTPLTPPAVTNQIQSITKSLSPINTHWARLKIAFHFQIFLS